MKKESVLVRFHGRNGTLVDRTIPKLQKKVKYEFKFKVNCKIFLSSSHSYGVSTSFTDN